MPIPGSPPSRTSGPGDEAAAQDAVELADPDRQPADLVGRRSSAGPRAPRARPPTRATARPRPRGASRTTVSTRVFHVAAGAALALPAEERVAAGLADEAALGRGPRPAQTRRQASTGVFASAAVDHRARPSGSLSTTIVVPGS